jgi:D-sedoheptulose 7-phosphate isomerase
MDQKKFNITNIIDRYTKDLSNLLDNFDWSPVIKLSEEIFNSVDNKRQLFICGNGGSAANAIHIANDFIYGISRTKSLGVICHSLPANQSVITCLANDEGYEKIFAYQLDVLAKPNDILLVLSGSGNSPNILEALATAKSIGMPSYAILGFDGGKAKQIADHPIHFNINDMQISEDLQMIVAHIIMKWMNKVNT